MWTTRALATALPLALMALVPPASAATQTDCGYFEAVEPGDTLGAISARCNVPIATLRALNPPVSLRDLRGGAVLTIKPAISAADQIKIDLMSRYETGVRGVWKDVGGTCADIAGTWTFGAAALRGNDTSYDLNGIFGTPDRFVLDITRRRDGAPLNLIVRPTGRDRIAISGPGIRADLTRCSATPPPAKPPLAEALRPPTRTTLPPDLTGRSDGPRSAYLETFFGSWRSGAAACSDVAGAWDFAGDRITANGTLYAIESFTGETNDIRLNLRHVGTGDRFPLDLSPTALGRATAVGPGIAADLIRCR